MAFVLQLGDKMLVKWDSSSENSASDGKASRSQIEEVLPIAVKEFVGTNIEMFYKAERRM